MNSIPAILLTGYLGSGKTTFLNHLLSSPPWRDQRVALLINEFGPLGIDGSLVQGEAEKTYEINQGSLFCSCTHEQLLKVLEDLAGNVRPEVVLIEATGIAEPADFLQLIGAEHLKGLFEVRATICLVDAERFPTAAATMRAARKQVEFADGLVINKTDLVDEEELQKLRTLLGGMAPRAEQTTAAWGRVEPEWVLSLQHIQRTGEVASAPPIDVYAHTFTAETPLDRRAFERFLAELGGQLLRLKGNVDFGRGGRFIELAGSKLLEREPVDLKGPSTNLAMIVWQRPRNQLQADLDALTPED
jgi:G3E family GTPase